MLIGIPMICSTHASRWGAADLRLVSAPQPVGSALLGGRVERASQVGLVDGGLQGLRVAVPVYVAPETMSICADCASTASWL